MRVSAGRIATAVAVTVGGTQYAYDPQPGGNSAFVSVDDYFYGPTSSGSCGSGGGNCWYAVEHHRFGNWNQASWHGEYDSTRLVSNADRAPRLLPRGCP